MSVLVSRCAFRSVELIRKFNRSIDIRKCFGNTIINSDRSASTLCQSYTFKPPGRNDNTAATINCMSLRFKSSKKGDKRNRNAHEDSDEVWECPINSVCLSTKCFFVFPFFLQDSDSDSDSDSDMSKFSETGGKDENLVRKKVQSMRLDALVKSILGTSRK